MEWRRTRRRPFMRGALDTMITRPALWLLFLVMLGACGDDKNTLQPSIPTSVAAFDEIVRTAPVGRPLPDLRVRVSDAAGNEAPGVEVTWTVVDGGGTISPSTSITGSDGTAAAEFTLGPAEGEQRAQASVAGLAGSPVVFTAAAIPPIEVNLGVLSGGNNVPERFGSDLWVHGSYAYTGTWGAFPRSTNFGDVLKIWSLGPSGAPTLVDSVKVADISTVSDVQVSEDGQLLVFSAEFDPEGGVYLYSLADPAHPAFRDRVVVPGGVHTATLAEIGGGRYVFAARNP